MHIPIEEIKKIILKSGIVEENEYQEAENEAHRTKSSIEDVLISRNQITEDFFIEIISDYLDVPRINLSNKKIKFKDLDFVNRAYAQKKQIIIFQKDKEFINVAMADPMDLETIEYVKVKAGMPVKIFIAGKGNIARAWKKYRKDIGKEFHKIINSNVEKAQLSIDDAVKTAQDVPVISIMDTIIDYAISANSSDIHLEIFQDKVIIRYRIDGILHDIVDLPKALQSALITRIKILSNLKIDEHRTPQDGRFKFKTADGNIAIRVSVMPTFHGEKAVLRILSGSTRPISLSELGLSEENYLKVQSNIKKTQGIILITGPTGSGKTTSLYSILHILNQQEVNICTIEDPIEYDISRINQTQVNNKTGLTFASGLRSFLRQDPNIIMVGEIRDRETLEMAIHASLTGHLVLSTLHTNNAALAIPRLIDMGAEPFLLASTLNMIVAQRLVRSNCKKCLTTSDIREEDMKIIKSQLELNKNSRFNIDNFDKFYMSKGCPNCGKTGFHGRIGIFEILESTPRIKKLILEKAEGDEIKKVATEEGMVPMFEDGLEKIQKGDTTLQEVLRVVRE